MKTPLISSTNPLLPSTQAWLGVMGGGQLGRMFVQAAQKMGYKVAVLESQVESPAGSIAERQIQTSYTDALGLQELAAQCQAISTEFENVPADSLAHLAQDCFVAPSAAAVAIAQDRMAEKRLFTACADSSGILPVAHQLIRQISDLAQVDAALLPGILKTRRMGYDGKGQIRVSDRAQLEKAFAELGGVDCVLEKMLPLAHEISVLVARGVDGEAKVYPVAENLHVNGILHTSSIPAPQLSPSNSARAQAAALRIASELEYVGVLCVEFFVLHDGTLVVNEMAPRPHNSGHYSMDACMTSQFEQQVRCMTGLPLGDVRQHSPAIMLNLLGEVWLSEGQVQEPPWQKILALPGANLHLYGKLEARPGRKMGHITFCSETLAQAQENLQQACTILGIKP